MASSMEFVEYVCEQIAGGGEISYKKMFGEFGVYCNNKVIGMICKDQFFLKKTSFGENRLGCDAEEAPPYANAKPYLLIETLDDREFLADLIAGTCEELPMPRPKKKKVSL